MLKLFLYKKKIKIYSIIDMNNIIKPKASGSRVVLGNPTPPMSANMLSYTINLSPNDYIGKLNCSWGKADPSKQVKFLRAVHKYAFVQMYKYLDTDEDDNNETNMEFTKNMEVHSHGWFTLQSKYGTYIKYVAILAKALKTMLPISKYNVVVKYAETPSGWKLYCRKDNTVTGYAPYKSKYCETTVKDILFFTQALDRVLPDDLKLFTEDKNDKEDKSVCDNPPL